jgi:putative component of membrane protein insertase Oxa1/YidC/SpoIIIJ protein YidD
VAAVQYTFSRHPVAAVQYTFSRHPVAAVQYTFTLDSTQNTEKGTYMTIKKIGKCGPCPVYASYAMAFALQLRKKHRKTSVRVVEKSPISRWQ